MIVVTILTVSRIYKFSGCIDQRCLQLFLIPLSNLEQLSVIGVVESQHHSIVLVPESGGGDGEMGKIDSPFPVDIVVISSSVWLSPGPNNIHTHFLNDNLVLRTEFFFGKF